MVVYLSEYTFDNIEEIDANIIRGASVTAEMMDRAKKLKVIAKHGIGCNSIDVEAAKQRGIQVIYTPTANADSVAELTVALFLLLQRRLYEANEGCRAGRFTSIAPRDFRQDLRPDRHGKYRPTYRPYHAQRLRREGTGL